ncbi:MAG: VWA domain-containing protein, partial [Clostridium sp.]|nr:VWA domain-containing protein [Clostridium sp.]
TYTCEPYNFSFVIKASKTGIFENVFNNSKISFPWKDDEKIECQMPVKQLEIEDNTLPIIQAKYQNSGEEIIGLNQGDTFDVVYDIIPKDFELNSSDDGTGLKDIVVLIDTSSSMAGNNKLVPLLNSIDNQIVSKFTDNDSKTDDNTQIAFVTYNSKINIYTESSDGNPFLKTQGGLHNKILEIRNEPLNDPERNVEKAVEEAERILNSNYAQSDASKNIIIISSDEVNDYENLDKDSIRNGNYNIISIELRKESNKEIGSFKELHTELGGGTDCYIASNPDGGNYNDLESVMKRAAEKIALSRKTLYEFKSVQLGFDVGNKLIPSSEVVITTAGNESIKEAIISEKRIIIDLPVVKYRYNSDINMYVSEPFQVKFRVTIDGEGIIEFNKNRNDDIRNYIQFEKINKTSPKNRIEDTPSIIVENSMRHGIYDSEAEGNIDETLTKKIPQDAVVPMAGYFETFSDGQRIEIQLNQGLEACGKVQIINTETSETISSNSLFNDNNYEQNIDSKGKYLVLYSVKVNSVNNTKVTLRKYNTSTSNPQEKSYQIQVGNVLPDLF